MNQAVKRNEDRFPERFRFRLSQSEMDELITNCDKSGRLRHYPEHFDRKHTPPPQDFRCRPQDLQRPVSETRRPLQRIVPRPLPHRRRKGTLPHRRIPERPRSEVLRLHKAGRWRNPPHQEGGVCDGCRRLTKYEGVSQISIR